MNGCSNRKVGRKSVGYTTDKIGFATQYRTGVDPPLIGDVSKWWRLVRRLPVHVSIQRKSPVPSAGLFFQPVLLSACGCTGIAIIFAVPTQTLRSPAPRR